MHETIDVVDDHDRVLRQATRAEMRQANLLHRAVYVLVRNRRGDLFVHRRTATKDVYPGHWDVTVGGVVAAGEDYLCAARRELREELGIATAALSPLGRFRYEDAATRVLGMGFVVEHDGPVTLQAEEIESGGFVSLAEVERLIAERPCCPDGVAVLRRYLGAATVE
jgi:isopentenyldiphosphate isomerase